MVPYRNALAKSHAEKKNLLKQITVETCFINFVYTVMQLKTLFHLSLQTMHTK